MENSLIKEEDVSKARKFFDEFKQDDMKFLSKVEIVDRFTFRHEEGMTLKKFIKAFRHDHGKRFAFN